MKLFAYLLSLLMSIALVACSGGDDKPKLFYKATTEHPTQDGSSTYKLHDGYMVLTKVDENTIEFKNFNIAFKTDDTVHLVADKDPSIFKKTAKGWLQEYEEELNEPETTVNTN